MEKCYIYLDVNGSYFTNIMLSFEDLGITMYNTHITCESLDEFCKFLIDKAYSFRLLDKFMVNLHGDTYEYTIPEFLKLHHKELK